MRRTTTRRVGDRRMPRALGSGVLLLAGAIALSGCGAGADAQEVPAGETVTVSDAWVKAADDGMTAGFGLLANGGDAEATIVSAESEVAGTIELHETVAGDDGEMIMREVEGGFALPAASDLALEPGGSHLMFMDLSRPLRAGDEVEVTLTFSDASTSTFSAPVKDYAGANENYGGAEGEADGEQEGHGADSDHGDGEGHGGSASGGGR